MPRIKLKLPKIYHFETNLQLRIYDMNYGAHLGNDSVLSIVHEARVQFFNSFGQEEKDFFGISLLMADSAVVYKKEAFYGEKLNIKVAVTEFYNFGFELFYLLSHNNSEIARVKSGMVCYNTNLKKIHKVPSDFVNSFS
ncbi:MAG: thioesterase [Flavobacteriales bacterium]|nr:thioesterase [Flavobacteriales bacterium]|tara:strand:- start:27689 stop:28105 length:417 start_codon:yes stop_codon:yes gene_type:complete